MEPQFVRRSTRQCHQTTFFTFERENTSGPYHRRQKQRSVPPPPTPSSDTRKIFTAKRQGWVSGLKTKVAFSPSGLGRTGTRSFRSTEFFNVLCEFLKSKIPDLTTANVKHWIKLHPWITEEMHFKAPSKDDNQRTSTAAQTPKASVMNAARNAVGKAAKKVQSPKSTPTLHQILDDILDWEDVEGSIPPIEETSSDDEGPPFLLIQTNTAQRSFEPFGPFEPIAIPKREPSTPTVQERGDVDTQKIPIGQPEVRQIPDQEGSTDSRPDVDDADNACTAHTDDTAGNAGPAHTADTADTGETSQGTVLVPDWLETSNFGRKLDEFRDLNTAQDLSLEAHHQTLEIPLVNDSALHLVMKTLGAMELAVMPVSYDDCLQTRLTPTKSEYFPFLDENGQDVRLLM